MNNQDEVNYSKQDEAFEYVFEAVPPNKRKSLMSLILVLTGYTIALSNFVYGGQVAAGLSLTNAIIAIFIGNFILITVVIITGLLAYKTGLSTTFLSMRAFGKGGSHIFSIMLSMCAIIFVSTYGDIFSRLIKTTFDWWPIPIPLTAILVIYMWFLSSRKGYKGLQFISALGVPAALFLCVFGIYAAGASTNGFEGVSTYTPTEPMTFTAATAAIVGGWIFGATITPDVCRFAKRKLHVWIAGSIAFIIGCLGLMIGGALIAISTGEADFIIAMASLGIVMVAFFASVFCLWTTQDNNIYAASLALQNVLKDTKYSGKIKHKHNAFALATIAAILAAGGIYSYIVPLIKILSLLIPSVAAIIIAEEFFIKVPKQKLKINKNAIIAWIIGGISSYLSLSTDFFIPPLIGMLCAGLVYFVLEKNRQKQASIAIEIDNRAI